MIRRSLLLLSLVCLAAALPAAAGAAVIAGTVTDRETGEALGFASVQLAGETVRTGTVSGDDGGFRFPGLGPGRYEVRVFFVGYTAFADTVDVPPGDGPGGSGPEPEIRVDCALVPEGFQVERVEVVAERVREEPATQVGFVNLDEEQLRSVPSIGEADPLRSLQLLPGVQAASDISSGLYVRGGGPDQTLILLDQVTVYNPSHAFGLFSTFNADVVDQVTLYKGAYPAEYTGRLGSVLDVRNRDGSPGGIGGTGGISTLAGRLLLEGPVGNGSWLVSGRRTYLDPILNALRRDNEQIPSYYFYDLNGKLRFNTTAGDIVRASAYGGRDDIGFDLAEETFLDWVWGNRTGSLSFTRFLGDDAFVELQAQGSEYESIAGARFFSTPVSIENRLRDVTLRADLTAEAGEDHTVRAGLSGSSYRFTYRQVFNDEPIVSYGSEPYDVSVYAEDEWRSWTGAVIRGGLRARYFSEGGRALWEPRLSASRPVSGGWTVKLGAGLYHQYLQLVATEGFAAGDFYFPVDETSQPGRSWQLVAGAAWSPSPAYEVSGEAYYTGLGRLLVLDGNSPNQIPDPTTEDIFLTGGTGFATGLELFAQKRTGALRGWIGYTLGWTRREFAELNGGGAFPPKYDRRHDLKLVGTLDRGKWTFGSSFVYGTGQAFTQAVARYGIVDPARGTVEEGGFVLPGDKNDARLLPYHRLDVSVNRDFSLFGLEAEWFLQVFNLYSRRNEWFIQYDTDDPAAVEPEIVRQLPIIPSLGVNFAF